MERRGNEILVSGLDIISNVQDALEAAGVQFLDDGQLASGPGVAMRDCVMRFALVAPLVYAVITSYDNRYCACAP